MITQKSLADKHAQTARNAFKATVEGQIDLLLDKNWIPGNSVTVVLDEVFPDADKRVRAFMTPVILETYGGDKSDWLVTYENGIFLFKARSEQS